MRHRSPARWLAPVALVTCAVAVYAVVHGGASSDGKGRRSGPAVHTTGSTPTKTTSKRARARKARTYVVKAGDVLSAIAEKTGVTVAEIERLNPSVDAAALHPGQKLRLTR
jgi:LysM repeat protein